MWKQALLIAAVGCSESTSPVGLPEQLRLRVETSAASLTTNDTLWLRLVAVNPLSIPIVFQVRCTDGGLTFRISDADGPITGEGGLICAELSASGTGLIRLAPGDSLVDTARWVPRRYGGDIVYLVPRPAGPYAVAAVIELDSELRAVSSPVAFELRAP